VAAATSDLAFLPAVDQAELIRRRQVTPVELVDLYLERIDRIDPALNAYVTVCAEETLTAARAAADQAPGRPFHGVPIPVKDLTETAGIRTTFSCRAYADYVPDRDVAVVGRLREAGFILLGKTNASELGSLAVTDSRLNGPCRNPWDTTLNAGGSSGGAAAALSAGLCPVAHGTDGGGSIRIPASCCGVVGLKPARGRISRAPYAGFEGLPTDGPIARTVRDAAALLDAMEGYDAGDPWWAPPPERPFVQEVGAPPRRLRIAVTTEPPVEVPVDSACARAVGEAAELLAGLGHHVEEAEPDWHGPELRDAFACVWQVGAALMPVEDRGLLDPVNRALVEAAEGTSSVAYAVSAVRLAAWGRRVVGLWNDFDVLLTPTLAMLPVPVGWLSAEETDVDAFFDRGSRFTPFTVVANVTGLPAISLPLAWHEGLPVGVQLVGGPAGEATLIRLAAQLEEARPWADRRPPDVT
jgi:amidase